MMKSDDVLMMMISNEIDDGVTLSDEPRLRLSSNQLRRKQPPHRSYSAPPRAQAQWLPA